MCSCKQIRGLSTHYRVPVSARELTSYAFIRSHSVKIIHLDQLCPSPLLHQHSSSRGSGMTPSQIKHRRARSAGGSAGLVTRGWRRVRGDAPFVTSSLHWTAKEGFLSWRS